MNRWPPEEIQKEEEEEAPRTEPPEGEQRKAQGEPLNVVQRYGNTTLIHFSALMHLPLHRRRGTATRTDASSASSYDRSTKKTPHVNSATETCFSCVLFKFTVLFTPPPLLRVSSSPDLIGDQVRSCSLSLLPHTLILIDPNDLLSVS